MAHLVCGLGSSKAFWVYLSHTRTSNALLNDPFSDKETSYGCEGHAVTLLVVSRTIHYTLTILVPFDNSAASTFV